MPGVAGADSLKRRGGYSPRMRLRETASITLDATPERVGEVLSRWMETDPAMRRTETGRFETTARDAGLATFILRGDGSRTRVIHARDAPLSLRAGFRARENLRQEVVEELDRVERLVRAYGAP